MVHVCVYCGPLRVDCLEVPPAGGGSTGRWADTTTPKRNWHCTGAEDLGAPEHECEMCERETVRYVHHMEHGVPPNVLRLAVGCICAGHMDGSIADAKARVATLLNRDARRRAFPTLAGWKLSQSGNRYIKKDGRRYVVVHRNGRFTVSIDGNFLPGFRGSEEDAMLMAFDHVYPARIPA